MELCITVIIQCLTLSLIYVGSLYIWSYRFERDHPATIKKRFISVGIVALISPIYVYLCIKQPYLDKISLWSVLGIRIQGLWQAIVYPLLLTVILFLGPVTFQIFKGMCNVRTIKDYWHNSFTDLIWWRNHVVAPLSEEITFRACMIPLLLQCMNIYATIFICPLFFGAAHFNHLIEDLKAGCDLKQSILVTCFRFLYTTIFGIYGTFLFLRTGHLVAPVIAHIFCNHMGSPDITEPFQFTGFKRYALISLFCLGLGAWYAILIPFTEPSLFENTLYWNSNYSFV